jgi:hypothetical protein
MRKMNAVAISAALILAGVAPTTTSATWELDTSEFGRLKTGSYVKQAFTLEEMNCFSSDIHAVEPAEAPGATSDDAVVLRLASSTGTNGIPCDRRDPKAPPKKKRSRS